MRYMVLLLLSFSLLILTVPEANACGGHKKAGMRGKRTAVSAAFKYTRASLRQGGKRRLHGARAVRRQGGRARNASRAWQMGQGQVEGSLPGNRLNYQAISRQAHKLSVRGKIRPAGQDKWNQCIREYPASDLEEESLELPQAETLAPPARCTQKRALQSV